jgi:hypothetical protein
MVKLTSRSATLARPFCLRRSIADPVSNATMCPCLTSAKASFQVCAILRRLPTPELCRLTKHHHVFARH